MRQFDMNQALMVTKGDFLALRVEGLAEGRPSLMVGDKAIASVPGTLDGPFYEGYIHIVTKWVNCPAWDCPHCWQVSVFAFLWLDFPSSILPTHGALEQR